jgi:hypothetical protein
MSAGYNTHHSRMLQDLRFLSVTSALDSIGLVCYIINSMEQSSPEKLIVPQLFMKLPAFYGILKFTSAVTIALQMSVSCTRSVQSMNHIYFLKICFNIIVRSVSTSSKRSVSFSFPPPKSVCMPFLYYPCYIPAHLTILDLITGIIYRD